MPLARLPEPFSHPDWQFEVKYDGFRALAYLKAGALRLVSRNGNQFKSFPGPVRDDGRVHQRGIAVLDGEIIYLGRRTRVCG